jgi:hypothetical protein
MALIYLLRGVVFSMEKYFPGKCAVRPGRDSRKAISRGDGGISKSIFFFSGSEGDFGVAIAAIF